MKLKKVITIQDSAPELNRYLLEIRGYESLTKEEEKDLIIKIHENNDRKALDKLVKANLKFVISVAKHYQGQGASLIDLISEGNYGMMQAVAKFDTSKDLKFFSYAVWWIRIRMFTALHLHKRTIQLPANRELLVDRIKHEVLELEQKLGRYPMIEELAEFLNGEFSEGELKEAILHNGKTKSIQEKINDKDDEDCETWEQVIEGDRSLGIDEIDKHESLSKDLERFFYQLSQTQYDILVLTLGLNGESARRAEDVALELGMKEKEVLKLKMQAIKRMKKLKNIKDLKEFL